MIEQPALPKPDDPQEVAVNRMQAMAMPWPSSKPSSVPCLMLLAIEGSFFRSPSRMPRTSTPEALKAEDASA